MKRLYFVTGNDHKFLTADSICREFDIQLERKNLDVTEIQSELGETIAQHKAASAFEQLKQPVVIADDNWFIPGLNGFPGPYMKSMNEWLSPEDFIRLTAHLEDRRIILKPTIAYHDTDTQKTFTADIEGLLLPEARGTSPYPIFTITSFDGGVHSAAEVTAGGHSATADHDTAWRDFATWYQTNR